MTDLYIGSELDLFSQAHRWKTYFASILRPYIRGHVLEVGAGIGANTPYLANPSIRHWISLEPDHLLAQRILQIASNHKLPFEWEVMTGTIAALEPATRFDTILYIDVLEHIDDDRGELARSARHLQKHGNLVVLAPAHNFLFSPFDTNIGHFRRYSHATLTALAPPGCRLHSCLMLDAAGFAASLANRLVLSSSMPTPRQIAFWNSVLVPISRSLDWLTRYSIGKSVIAAWTRE